MSETAALTVMTRGKRRLPFREGEFRCMGMEKTLAVRHGDDAATSDTITLSMNFLT